ncbi:MAG: DUF1080 domain-containing protein [Planctomycetota bacterium]|nr:MAG: DUF1080 domain-containing protein [Planctomycetota bacterium]
MSWKTGRFVITLSVALMAGPGLGWFERGCAQDQAPAVAADERANSDATASQAGSRTIALSTEADAEGWRPLLPKEGLDGWEITDFGTEGKVYRDGDLLIIEMGDPLNGITYKGKDFPTNNFEIYVEANRLDGNDFFCGLTFPVGKEFCSFIAGGWGGSLVGLSSVDGFDASENATTTAEDFENNKWYRFKVRVDDEYIRAWINDEEFFRQERDGHEFSTRIEVYASQPLGYAAYMSKVAVRNFKWRPIPPVKKAGE